MTEQEIRAKALEIAVQSIALLNQKARDLFLSSNGKKAQENIIAISKMFEDHIKNPKNQQ